MNSLHLNGKKGYQDRILMMVIKRRLPGTFFLLLLSSIAHGLGSVVLVDYWYNGSCHTWHEAQKACYQKDYDLMAIYTQLYAEDLHLNNYVVWIDSQNCDVADYYSLRVHKVICEEYFFFICNDPYELVTQPKTKSEALQYCFKNSRSLANISELEAKRLAGDKQDFLMWTGLHRDGEMWRTALSHYKSWTLSTSANNGDCVSIATVQKEMATQNCSIRLPFVCYTDNLVLVKENKTWEEALEHCRALHSSTEPNLNYDLVSVQPEDYSYVMNKVMEANTEEVWTGLRFLAGEWLWVNSADMLYSGLPLCPNMLQRCGTLSKGGTGHMETRDCAEKRNFMCYSMQAS